jgi:hypothetical protein
MRLEGLGQLKNPITSSGIELATFRLEAVPQPTTLSRAPNGFLLALAIETNMLMQSK